MLHDKKCRNAYITPTANSVTKKNWDVKTKKEEQYQNERYESSLHWHKLSLDMVLR